MRQVVFASLSNSLLTATALILHPPKLCYHERVYRFRGVIPNAVRRSFMFISLHSLELRFFSNCYLAPHASNILIILKKSEVSSFSNHLKPTLIAIFNAQTI